MTPLNGARCFVNGTQVVEKTPLLHGDRIVWGNHHFFRVNCPRSATGNAYNGYRWLNSLRSMRDIRVCMWLSLLPAINSEPQTPAQNIDYTFAREELMLNELSNDPIQRAIARLEKQHEEDKQVCLGTNDVWWEFIEMLLLLKRREIGSINFDEEILLILKIKKLIILRIYINVKINIKTCKKWL